jgi:flagellar basal body-associated protein FliL
MLQEIYAIVAVLLGLAMCAVVVYFLLTGRHDRDREEEAREYFDRHGHWPDEGPTA